jgi:hypothetical protein
MDNTDKIATSKSMVVNRRQKSSQYQTSYISPEKPIGSIITSQLLPFANTMRLQLRRRGYNTDSLSLKDVIPLYYNEFVVEDKLQPVSHFEFINNPAFKVRPSDNLNGELTDVHKDFFGDISDVVYNIIQKFKLSRDKKRSASLNGMDYMEVLTIDEVVQAKATEKVTKDLQQKLLGNVGITVNDMKGIMLIAIALWVAYLFIDSL